MIWTEQKLKRLGEINKMKKIERYFAFKNFVNELTQEEPQRILSRDEQCAEILENGFTTEYTKAV